MIVNNYFKKIIKKENVVNKLGDYFQRVFKVKFLKIHSINITNS